MSKHYTKGFFMHKEPLKSAVIAKGHTPQYSMHKYFARRPYNVFENLIKHYTEENDIILDCFCGGGVTIFEGLKQNRKVIGVDLNPLAAFITEMQVKQVEISTLRDYLYSFYNAIDEKLGKDYKFTINDKIVNIEWIEWVYELECCFCETKVPLTSNNKLSNGVFVCPNEMCEGHEKGIKRTKCTVKSSKPVRIKYNFEDKTYTKTLSEKDANKLCKLDDNYILDDTLRNVDADIPKDWDRWYEDCLPQKGIHKFSDFFTKKNFYINTVIFNEILKEQEGLFRDILYFAFSSSLRYTNKMSRVTEGWENGNPTCMDKHAYWLPNEYIENNVLIQFKNRIEAVIKGLSFTASAIKNKKRQCYSFEDLKTADYMVLNRSSSNLPIPNNSVDAVITDPPYGSNVQYGELSAFWNIWYKTYRGLDNFIYKEEEAVSNRKKCYDGAKDISFYGNMLYSIFKECNRVLKKDGCLVFTFNNKDINVWIQLLRAAINAGFVIPEGGILYQDFVKEYKNTSHLHYSGNIHGDFIYTFVKGTIDKNKETNIDDIEKSLQNEIINLIERLFIQKESYTTTELYTSIFSQILSVLVQYVVNVKEKDANVMIQKVDILSKTFIDDILDKYLVQNNGEWSLKQKVVKNAV